MNSDKDMPITGHLDELRKRLTIVSVAHLIVMLLAFSRSGKILEKLMELNPQMHLIFVEPSEIMNVYIHIALVVAIGLCMPLTIYHLWAFVAKGLYDNEKKMVKIALALSFGFFLLGIIFAYKIVVPISLQFFTRIAIDQVSPMISVKSYISFILTLMLAMGVVFNIPSFAYLGTKLGILTPSFFNSYDKHLIVLIFILAAIITPPDVVSQCLIALPMVGLLKLSAFISTKTYKGKLTEAEKELADETKK